MIRSFSFRRAIALAALGAIAVALLQKGAPQSASNTEEVNLRAETQVTESLSTDLIAYRKECAQLSKKQNLLSTEVDGVGRKADALQSRLSNVQNAARTLISKLKAANKWDTLNETVLANADPRHRSFLQNIDFKTEIEEAAATLGSRGKELNLPVENLRKKVATSSGDPRSLMVAAAYSPAVPTTNSPLACAAGKLVMGAFHAAGVKVPDIVLDFTACGCTSTCTGCVASASVTGSYSCSDFGLGATR